MKISKSLLSDGPSAKEQREAMEARVAASRATQKTHTPGPWRSVPSTAGGGTARCDIVSDGAEFSPSFVAGDILPEDATLIAAAPDLLAAAQSALARLNALVFEGRNMPDDDQTAALLSDVIAKATGAAQ